MGSAALAQFLETVVREDRRRFFAGINASQLHEGTLLDLQHQTFLRVTKELMGDDYPYYLKAYGLQPEKRHQMWDVLKTKFPCDRPLGKLLASERIATAGGSSYLDGEVSGLWTLFEERVRNEPNLDSDIVWFSSPAGFAYYDHATIRDPIHQVWEVAETSCTSVGGMMYYGFNDRTTGRHYLQTDPINILVDTLLLHREYPDALLASYRSPQSNIVRELEFLADRDQIKEAVEDFLILHELGHNPGYAGNAKLFDILDRQKIDRSNFYAIDFPNADDLGAWRRIKRGRGSPRDVLFLLGDYLANMAVLDQGISKPTLHALRAFNWWLLREPYRSPPRGLGSFLAHSFDFDHTLFENEITSLMRTAVDQPSDLERCFRRFESASWDRLAKFCGETKEFALC